MNMLECWLSVVHAASHTVGAGLNVTSLSKIRQTVCLSPFLAKVGGNTKKVRAEQDMPNIALSCDSENGVSTHSIRERATVGYIAALNRHILTLY